MEMIPRKSGESTDRTNIADPSTVHFLDALELARSEVYKDYLSALETGQCVPMNNLLKGEIPRRCLRVFKLTQFTRRQGEDINQKLSTVYHAAMSQGCSLFIIVNVPCANAPVDFYLGVRAPDLLDRGGENPVKRQLPALGTSFKALENGLKSHFPGSDTEEISASQNLPALLDMIFSNRNGSEGFLASVSCVASIRDKQRTEQRDFIQGLEKLVDTMRGQAYTAVMIAEPFPEERQREIRAGYENLHTALSFLHKNVLSFQQSESKGVTDTLTDSITASITDSITETKSSTETTSRSSGSSTSLNAHGGLSIGFLGFGLSFGGGGGRTKFHSNSYSKAVGKSEATSHTKGASASVSASQSAQSTQGTSETIQMEWTDKHIEEMLARIDEHLRRLREGEDFGAYTCGAYFLSDRADACLLAANTYRALMLGEGSAVERGAVNVWSEETTVAGIKEYLRRLAHPFFAVPVVQGDEPLRVTPGTIVSGLELPLHLGLPTRSVMGLPVINHAEFGRNVLSGGADAIDLGSLYHMGRTENAVVRLDRQSLTAHTFITGSTGAGKTNTVCTLLQSVCLKPATPERSGEIGGTRPTFLVIEPAKGEYKDVLGTMEGVSVYGTNPKKTPLLRLNPFSFPEDIHVLEHIDRLVEIFNACWPMYAAMPAVLKDAIESAYQECGWSLSRSECPSGRFPTFADVLRRLPEIMEASDYSADTKGDYIGALVTRVRSLTNGINGQIFCAEDELSNEALFDRNVIVDLSRVGSMESKALLMGILTMKLLEYRMSVYETNNAHLRHITVLEEAHNLLRRTSVEQSQESSNLQGKSVEMLGNAIAEMRSYGEGFIIADQAPGLLDMAVIRNTNTKIIHRLPDESDRQLVGKAAGLNEAQIVELSRLDTGVAAVFQNNWQEPVLCQVDKLPDNQGGRYASHPDASILRQCENDAFFRRLLHGTQDGKELSKEETDRIRNWIDRLNDSGQDKTLLRRALEQGGLVQNEKARLAYSLTDCKTILMQWERRSSHLNRLADILSLMRTLAQDKLRISDVLAEELVTLAMEYASRQEGQEEIADWYREILENGGVR